MGKIMEKLSNCFKLEGACMLIGLLDFIIYLSLTLVSAYFFGTDVLDMKKAKYFAHQDIYDGLSRFGVEGEAMRANAKVDDLTIITDVFITFSFTLVFFCGAYFSYMLVQGCRTRSSSMVKPALLIKTCMILFPTAVMVVVTPKYFCFVALHFLEILALFALWRKFNLEEVKGLIAVNGVKT